MSVSDRPRLYLATVELDCLVVRLLLDILAVPFEAVPVDVFPGHDLASRTRLAAGPLPLEP